MFTPAAGYRPDRRRDSRDSERGLTLLEVLVALAILTTVSLGVGVVVVPLSRQVRIERELEVANFELGEVLEKVQSTPFFELQDIYPDGTEILLAELDQGRIVIDYDDPTADPLLLTATLSWQSSDQGTMTRVFRTVRTE